MVGFITLPFLPVSWMVFYLKVRNVIEFIITDMHALGLEKNFLEINTKDFCLVNVEDLLVC